MSSDFEIQLLEILLTLILMFNMGAYSFLWYKIRRVEDDVNENDRMLRKLFRRIFGINEDETHDGHLVETQQEFRNINKRFDNIENKIDVIRNSNEQAHDNLAGMFQELASVLVEKDNIDVTVEDIENIKR